MLDSFCFGHEADVLIRLRIFYGNRRFLCSVCIVAFLVAGCGFVQEEDHDVVIVVGSRHITLEELEKDIEFVCGGLDVPELQWDQFRNQLAEQVIGQYLILEYGKEKGILVAEEELRSALMEVNREYTESGLKNALLREYVDVDQWKDRFKEKLLVDKVLKNVTENILPPSYQDIEKYYGEHGEEFRFPRMLRFKQILTRTKEAAEDLLGRIENGEDLSHLAREYSIAPEADEGGAVGWVAREHLDESMAKVLFSMSPGEVSPIIKTSYGYHLFEVLSVRPAGVKPLPEVLGQIEAKLFEQKRESFLKEWRSDLRTHFEVKVNQQLLRQLELS
jgi:parvulin-like peptidyl-prolyl isomerase